MAFTWLAPAWAKNYSAMNVRKTGFCVHHAVTLDVQSTARVFQEAQASTQWGIDHAHAMQYVPENAYAWAAADTWANTYLEHVEVSNSSLTAPYPISEAAVENLILLMVERSRYRGWGKYVFGKNLFYHQQFAATACPGTLIPRMSEIADRANAILAGNTPSQEIAQEPTSEPVPDTVGCFTEDDIVAPIELIDYRGIALTQYDETYAITELIGDRAVLSANRDGTYVVWAAMNVNNIRHV